MIIDYKAHASQQLIHDARDARFRTICTGRRFGKTLCMAAELLDRGGGEIGNSELLIVPADWGKEDPSCQHNRNTGAWAGGWMR